MDFVPLGIMLALVTLIIFCLIVAFGIVMFWPQFRQWWSEEKEVGSRK